MLDRAYLAEGMPTLVIWGRRDAVIPLGHGRLAHAAMPGSEFEIFDEAGHFPHHTDPSRFIQLVTDFVAPDRAGPLRRRALGATTAQGSHHAGPPSRRVDDLELMSLPLSSLPSAH